MMLQVFLILFTIAFLAEFAAATLGMGYGTTLAPILIIIGYDPLVIVPVILFSQLFAATVASLFHHKFRNMDLSNSRERRSLAIFATTGVVGVIVSIMVSITLPTLVVKVYIALTVIIVGFLSLMNGHRKVAFSTSKLATIGIVAAFNKGISGGGYGPISTAGQMICGVEPRAAIAITALVEGIICAVGVILYWLLVINYDLLLLIGITVGGISAAPFSAFTTKSLKQEHLRGIVATAIILIGFASLVYVLIGPVG